MLKKSFIAIRGHILRNIFIYIVLLTQFTLGYFFLTEADETLAVAAGAFIIVVLTGLTEVITNSRLLTFAVFFFAWLQLLVMPFTYYKMLDADPDSFLVNPQVAARIKNTTAEELERSYKMKQADKQYSIIGILLTQQDCGSISMKDLVNGKQVRLGEMLIKAKFGQSQSENILPPVKEIRIFNTNYADEMNLVDMPGIRDNLSLKTTTLKDFFEAEKNLMEIRRRNWEIDQNAIDNEKFWRMRNLLPYCLNMTSSGVFAPMSLKANVVVYIHRLVIDNLTLGLIITILLDFLRTWTNRRKPGD